MTTRVRHTTDGTGTHTVELQKLSGTRWVTVQGTRLRTTASGAADEHAAWCAAQGG